LIEIEGEEDKCYGIIHNFDLLSAKDAFEKVTDFSFGFENEGGAVFTIGGEFEGQEVTVRIYTYPFKDTNEPLMLDHNCPSNNPHWG